MKGIFTQMNQHDQQESDLPTGLASPARRALVGAGYVRLEQFTQLSEAEVLRLHGMGPKAVDQLRRALADKGLSFAERKKSQAKDEG
jgi:DNA-directed RNA polymerase alpha subunit